VGGLDDVGGDCARAVGMESKNTDSSDEASRVVSAARRGLPVQILEKNDPR
jgi:hypothetical protein